MFVGITVSFGLVALAGGIALLIWALRNEGKGVAIAKFFGYFITVIALIVISTATFFGGIKFFKMKQMMDGSCPMCQMMKKDNSTETKTKSMPMNMQKQ